MSWNGSEDQTSECKDNTCDLIGAQFMLVSFHHWHWDPLTGLAVSFLNSRREGREMVIIHPEFSGTVLLLLSVPITQGVLI